MNTSPAHTIPDCPVCLDRQAVSLLCEVNGFSLWRCAASATDFVWPSPDSEALKAFYDREAWFEGGEPGGYQSYDAQTEHSMAMVAAILDESLDNFPSRETPRYILDVGCGYGSHLALAAQRGWKCFGIETSAHARKKAIERHGDQALVVADVAALIPHRFDLVLMLDVIEHLADPFALLFELFGKGAIGPDTLLVITTPNARSSDALRDPENWIYRHPPSHLTYFSARALRTLLQRLHFTEISISGTSPLDLPDAPSHQDEPFPENDTLRSYAGLLCKARGSDFVQFMQERYVPGTWSKIAEYEHLPRYHFAKRFAAGLRVLDFGCGTGYGSALLSGAASSVLGLDIDTAALQWARQTHRQPGLGFDQRSDLGAGITTASFDLVTCFEMIEHVGHETQIGAVREMARLLTPSGKLIISTPNPEITALYGENPYHLREMSEAEFLDLLQPFFAHIVILRQWVAPGILIAQQPGTLDQNPCCQKNENKDLSIRFSERHTPSIALAYIAVCSQTPLGEIDGLCEFDGKADFIGTTLRNEQTLNQQRCDFHALWEEKNVLRQQVELYASDSLALTKRIQDTQDRFDETVANYKDYLLDRERSITALQANLSSRDEHIRNLELTLSSRDEHIRNLELALSSRDEHIRNLELTLSSRDEHIRNLELALSSRDEHIRNLELTLSSRDARIAACEAETLALRSTRCFRLAETWQHHPMSMKKIADITYLVGAILLPEAIKQPLRAFLKKLRT